MKLRLPRLAVSMAISKIRILLMSYRDWAMPVSCWDIASVQWADSFSRWDIVLCPAAPVTAFEHDILPMHSRTLDIDGSKVTYESLGLWSALATPSGLPVTTVPIGLSQIGLPIGMQIVGPRLEDNSTIAFAELLEHQFGYRFQGAAASHSGLLTALAMATLNYWLCRSFDMPNRPMFN